MEGHKSHSGSLGQASQYNFYYKEVKNAWQSNKFQVILHAASGSASAALKEQLQAEIIIILPKNATVGSLVYMKQDGAHS